MKHLKIFLALAFLLTLFMSCGHAAKVSGHLSTSKIIKLSSMVQVISQYEIEHCIGDTCSTFRMSSTSTGSVIKKSKSGSYVLTTGHTCDPKFGVPFGLKNVYVKQTTVVVDSDKKAHKSITVEYNSKLDMCVLHTETLRAPAVKINYDNPPTQGDIAYNYAASYGVFGKRTIPILEGRFSGWLWGYALYTIPAIGGSSGSPIFDSKGELIGMIHSVHSRFHHLSFSPTHEQMIKFIKDNCPTVAPLGIRTEWTDIPGRKHKKIYLEPDEVKQYIKKVKKCKCIGHECLTKASCNIK